MAFWKSTKNSRPAEPSPPASPEKGEPEERKSFQDIFGAIEEELRRDTVPIPETQELPEEEELDERPPARQANRKRDCGVLVRFSETEFQLLKKRVARSGLSRSGYIRQVALEGRLPIQDRDETGKALSRFAGALDDLIAELGRQGGLLKLGMKPNQDRKSQDPEGWRELVQLIRYLERYVRAFKDKLEQMDKQKHDAGRLMELAEALEEVYISAHAQGIGLRDAIQPDLGQRVYTQEEWEGLCKLSRAVFERYQNSVSKILEEINGYYQAPVL